jgi:hypothetical protein
MRGLIRSLVLCSALVLVAFSSTFAQNGRTPDKKVPPPDTIYCTEILVYSLSVYVSDAVTGEPLKANVTAQTANRRFTLEDFGPTQTGQLYVGPPETPGNFTVTVRREGYTPYTQRNIVVRMDNVGCHVIPRKLNVKLTPTPAPQPPPTSSCEAERGALVAAYSDPKVLACISAAQEAGYVINPQITTTGSCIAGGFLRHIDFFKLPKCTDTQERPCPRPIATLVASVDLDCENNVTNSTCHTPAKSPEVRVKVGNSVSSSEGITIKFISVNEDSRCPANAICVWEGNARISLQLTDRKSTEVVELNTSTRFATEAKFGGYLIKLVSLLPYPGTKEKIDPSEYVATLRITKAD